MRAVCSIRAIKYQYRLDGADRDWSRPSDQRAVTYLGLARGTYRFLVRAVNGDASVSPRTAAVSFVVVPPFWRTTWFVTTLLSAAVLTGYGAHRWRTRRLLAFANMRTRIATDLHDDIGANLSRVAVLSEVVRRRGLRTDSQADAHLASIAAIARESASGMSDIVWAIDPERDRLVDLVRKMRAHAEEATSAAQIELVFEADGIDSLRLGMDVRRDLYLIFIPTAPAR